MSPKSPARVHSRHRLIPRLSPFQLFNMSIDKQVIRSTGMAGGSDVIAVIFINRASQGGVLADMVVILKFPIADQNMPGRTRKLDNSKRDIPRHVLARNIDPVRIPEISIRTRVENVGLTGVRRTQQGRWGVFGVDAIPAAPLSSNLQVVQN